MGENAGVFRLSSLGNGTSGLQSGSINLTFVSALCYGWYF